MNADNVLAAEPAEDLVLTRTAVSDGPVEPLDALESAILAALDDDLSTQALVERTGHDEDAVVAGVHRLLARGLVAHRPSPEAEEWVGQDTDPHIAAPDAELATVDDLPLFPDEPSAADEGPGSKHDITQVDFELPESLRDDQHQD